MAAYTPGVQVNGSPCATRYATPARHMTQRSIARALPIKIVRRVTRRAMMLPFTWFQCGENLITLQTKKPVPISVRVESRVLRLAWAQLRPEHFPLSPSLGTRRVASNPCRPTPSMAQTWLVLVVDRAAQKRKSGNIAVPRHCTTPIPGFRIGIMQPIKENSRNGYWAQSYCRITTQKPGVQRHPHVRLYTRLSRAGTMHHTKRKASRPSDFLGGLNSRSSSPER
jgi:hypothetical protein